MSSYKNFSQKDAIKKNWLDKNTSSKYSYDPIRSDPRLIADNLVVFGHRAYSYYDYSNGSLLNNYLGTIYNLPQPIVKTAASSMKVVYTLTDID